MSMIVILRPMSIRKLWWLSKASIVIPKIFDVLTIVEFFSIFKNNYNLIQYVLINRWGEYRVNIN